VALNISSNAPLHLFPDGITMWLDDHTTSHITVLGEVGLEHEIVVPFRVVLATFGEEIGHCPERGIIFVPK
jgi:hypothetical protein